LDTQLENGRTPSRATAKTRREAAMMAMAVFYIRLERVKRDAGWIPYQPQSDNANNVHKDVTTFAENDGIEGDERLRGAKLHQLIRGGLIGILVH
jgi:hypothetical protein